MPGILKVRVVQARDLPVMDSVSRLTDAYCEVKFHTEMVRTEIYRKSLNPVWKMDARFEVDDEQLQDEMLVIRVMDHDTLSNDDQIGQVVVDLDPLLKFDKVPGLYGWFPIYDTLHGVRGYLNLHVKLELFRDQNIFRDSSAGVLFSSTMALPECYHMLHIVGFVEELMVNDDPEYQWIEKIRSPRASNEARQALFSRMTGSLQRKIGLKALEMGGNAVIGYRQSFDLEGDSGMVARGIGTAVLVASSELRQQPGTATALSTSGLASANPGSSPSRASPNLMLEPEMQAESVSPRSLPSMLSPLRSGGAPTASTSLPSSDVPLLTLCAFDPGFIIRLGGVVTARSVKLLHKIDNPDDPDTRDEWWNEIRDEIRSHAVALGYSAVVGYVETTSICESLCLLSATGTCAVVNHDPLHGTYLKAGVDVVFKRSKKSMSDPSPSAIPETGSSADLEVADDSSDLACSICHLPYTLSSMPPVVAASMSLVPCNFCNKPDVVVPEVIFATVEPPPDCPIVGSGSLLQARVCRVKRKMRGADNAYAVGEAVPFLEYAVHRQLLNKMKVRGLNALFNLRVQVTVGELVIVGVASATGVHIPALPTPPSLAIHRSVGAGEDGKKTKIFEKVSEMCKQNRERLQQDYDVARAEGLFTNTEGLTEPWSTDTTGSSGQADKNTVVVEVDDAADEDVMAVLVEEPAPSECWTCTTEELPGLSKLKLVEGPSALTLTVVRKLALTNHQQINQEFSAVFDQLMQTVWFKVRHLRPCVVCNLRYDVQSPEDAEVQVTMTTDVVSLTDKQPRGSASVESLAQEELMFELDDESGGHTPNPPPAPLSMQPSTAPGFGGSTDLCAASEVEITSRNHVAGCKTARHLGIISLNVIKESASLKEAGGIERFVQGFIYEVQAIARAHVVSRGGNALVGYRLRHLDLLDNVHKNQGQCLISLVGDAVLVQSEHDSVTLPVPLFYDLDRQASSPAPGNSLPSPVLLTSPGVREHAL